MCFLKFSVILWIFTWFSAFLEIFMLLGQLLRILNRGWRNVPPCLMAAILCLFRTNIFNLLNSIHHLQNAGDLFNRLWSWIEFPKILGHQLIFPKSWRDTFKEPHYSCISGTCSTCSILENSPTSIHYSQYYSFNFGKQSQLKNSRSRVLKSILSRGVARLGRPF